MKIVTLIPSATEIVAFFGETKSLNLSKNKTLAKTREVTVP